MRDLRYVRHLPRELQTLAVLGLILLLASIAIMVSELLQGLTTIRAMLGSANVTPSAGQTESGLWWLFVGMALGILGAGCGWPVSAFMAHIRRPSRAFAWLESRQARIGVTLALAALPLCSLSAALWSALTSSPLVMWLALLAAGALNVFGAFALAVAYIVAISSTLLSFG